MYENVMNSLRVCGRIESTNDTCIAFHDGCCEAEPMCHYELMRKAADAIYHLELEVAALQTEAGGNVMGKEYIKREAALGILRGRSAPWDGYQKVKELPAADVRPVAKWIPVGERLPDLHGEEFSDASGETVRYQCSDPVLIWLGGGGDFIAIGTYEVDDHLEGWMMGGSVISCVTHWMPIPEPPTAEEGE